MSHELLKERVERLLDPESRLELGEDATRAAFAALGEAHLLPLLEQVERLERVLYPKLVVAVREGDE